MDNPLVSIVILTHNHEKFIQQALDGILMQKINFSDEIVIGEDFSSDRTREIICAYEKKYPDRIKVVTSEENIGAINNLMRSINACNGKYLAFCEGDDYWVDHLKLQKQTDFLEKNENYGMVHTDANHFDQKKQKLIKDFNKSNSINIPSGDIFSRLLKNFYFIKSATVMVRKELFLNVFDFMVCHDNQWLLTDLAIWLEVAANSKVKYFDETTATYRLLEESASRTKDWKKLLRFRLSVFDIRYYYWGKYSQDPDIKKKLDRVYYNTMISGAFRLCDLAIAKNAIKGMKERSVKVTIKQNIKYLFLLLIDLFPNKNKIMKILQAIPL